MRCEICDKDDPYTKTTRYNRRFKKILCSECSEAIRDCSSEIREQLAANPQDVVRFTILEDGSLDGNSREAEVEHELLASGQEYIPCVSSQSADED